MTPMKYLLLATTCFLLAASCAVADEKAASPNSASHDGGWQSLFDGKSLDAWETSQQAGIWAINPQGELFIAKEGKTLFTKQRYCDFVLELDWKVASKQQSNSGVFIRTHDKKDEVHTGFEIQILDDADYGY